MNYDPLYKELLLKEFSEDCMFSDETTQCALPLSGRALGVIIANQDGVFSGASILLAIRDLFPTTIEVVETSADGCSFEKGRALARLKGDYKTLLGVERTAINFLMHLCGVATLTNRYVELVKPYSTQILATRKTLPGLRELELSAVVHGGGRIHRRSLADGVLIKENHLIGLDPAAAIKRARRLKSPLHQVEIEVQDLGILDRVLEARPDIVLLDNLSVAEVTAAIHRIDQRALVEVSGGIHLDNVADYAKAGADFISVGRITHSAPACDLSLDICPEP